MSRASAAFARMHDRLFAHLGEEAVLRDGEPAIVVVTENVELLGDYGQVAQTVTTATFPVSQTPHPGDALTVAGQAWQIDRILRGDAHTVECILRKAA